jgi:hypothetical protein
MTDVSQAASLMGRRSVRARIQKWGRKEFVRKMQEWGKLGGRPKGAAKQNRRRGEIVGIYKRGEVYWYKFMWQGRSVRESTKQGNDKVARQMEAAHKTSLAKGEVGIREKRPVLTLAEFCRKRFAPWAESTCSHKTWRDFYRVGLMAIQAYSPLASLTLDGITTERIADFSSHRQVQGMKVTTVNASLRILRRVLRVAEEWGELERSPKVRMLPGGHPKLECFPANHTGSG